MTMPAIFFVASNNAFFSLMYLGRTAFNTGLATAEARRGRMAENIVILVMEWGVEMKKKKKRSSSSRVRPFFFVQSEVTSFECRAIVSRSPSLGLELCAVVHTGFLMHLPEPLTHSTHTQQDYSVCRLKTLHAATSPRTQQPLTIEREGTADPNSDRNAQNFTC